MPGTNRFRLDDAQRRWVRHCLAKAETPLAEPFEKFVDRIETSINHFLSRKPEGTFREAHDGLGEIWCLSHRDDPSPALLRFHLEALPQWALEYLGRRARAVLPILFPDDEFEADFFDSPERFVTKFMAWV